MGTRADACADDDGGPLYSLMQVCKPARVCVRRADGETQAIAMLRHRGRYLAASKAALSMLDEGASVELLDSGGAVLRVWRPADDDDDAPPETKPATTLDERDERLLTLLVRAQDHATQAQREATRDLLSAQRGMVDAMSSRLTSMEKLYSGVLRNLYDLTTDAANAQADATMREATAKAEATEAQSADTANELIKQIAPMALAKLSAVPK